MQDAATAAAASRELRWAPDRVGDRIADRISKADTRAARS